MVFCKFIIFNPLFFRQKQKQTFMNPRIFEHVLMLLSIYRFKPKARKFIFNMFEDLIFTDKMMIDSPFDF